MTTGRLYKRFRESNAVVPTGTIYDIVPSIDGQLVLPLAAAGERQPSAMSPSYPYKPIPGEVHNVQA